MMLVVFVHVVVKMSHFNYEAGRQHRIWTQESSMLRCC